MRAHARCYPQVAVVATVPEKKKKKERKKEKEIFIYTFKRDMKLVDAITYREYVK